MMKLLNTENASIVTATVTIRALTVTSRQVTLSLFRQLIEEDIFDKSTGTLRGVGWGHVRYMIESDPTLAINLVWQKGEELRRCIVEKTVGPRWTSRYLEEALKEKVSNLEVFARGSWWRAGDTYGCQEPLKKARLTISNNYAWEVQEEPLLIEFDIDPEYLRTLATYEWKGVANEPHVLRELESGSWSAIHARVNTIKESYDKLLRAQIQQNYDDELERIADRNAIVAPLFDLPQLFIAT